jgi:hypothetical protein
MNFNEAEEQFKKLKAQFDAGMLPEPKFKSELEELMIRDEQGRWWTIGYETGLWYRHDGKNWVQTDLSKDQSQKSVLIPTWIVMFWIMLGWASGSAIGIAFNYALSQNPGWITFSHALSQNPDWVALAIGGAVSGAIGGFSIATILQVQNMLFDWKNVLWIALSWIFGTAIAWGLSSPAIAWLIGGFATAMILWFQNILSDWKSVFWITLGWAGASAIGLAIVRITGPKEIVSVIVGWAVAGALGGAIGGAVMIWQIRESKK